MTGDKEHQSEQERRRDLLYLEINKLNVHLQILAGRPDREVEPSGCRTPADTSTDLLLLSGGESTRICSVFSTKSNVKQPFFFFRFSSPLPLSLDRGLIIHLDAHQGNTALLNPLEIQRKVEMY